MIARYFVRYEDGKIEPLPVAYGRDVIDWGNPQGDDAPSEPVWGAPRYEVYRTTYDNPRPGVPIAEIEFVSAMTRCAPFCIAITLE